MGIRPKFYIVVGIDDAKEDDPRYERPDEEWLEEIINFRELTEEECWRDTDDDGLFDDYRFAKRGDYGYSLQLYDILYNLHESSEYVVENIRGLITYKGRHDDHIIRALATLDEKFLQSGYEHIPLIDPEEHQLLYRHARYTEEDVKANRFVQSYFENMPPISRMHWKRAIHYLKLVGWTVKEEELRYMLVWDWS
jgi:hypothetical protein